MSGSEDGSNKLKFNKTKTNEEIILGFQKLRNEQRFLFNKLNEFDLDLQEHRVVLNTLKRLDGDRKCFRMIGGILCERTIRDVIPILKANEENLGKVMESYSEQLKAKENELNKYKNDYNLKFRPTDEFVQGNLLETKSQEVPSTNESSNGVLVT